MGKTQILMNKPVYLGLSKLDLGKTVMYEFWYDYIKPEYYENAKLCYMDTDSFIVHIKTDAETRFDSSNYELDRPLSKAKKLKVTGLMKDDFGGKIMKKSVGL